MTEDEAIKQDARVWVLRVESGDMSQAEKVRFDQWLSEDPRHKHAFLKEHKLWLKVAALEQDFKTDTDIELSRENGFEDDAFEDLASRANPTTPLSDMPPPKPMAGFAFGRSSVLRSVAAVLLVMLVCTYVFAEQFWIMIEADEYTSAGGQKQITLPDGSIAVLNTATAIAIDYSASERRIRLLEGEAFFKVQPNKARPFRVETQSGVGEAAGTSFAVHKTEQGAKITVSEGVVAVNLAASKTSSRAPYLLKVDQQIEYNKNQLIKPVHKVDAQKALAWQKGKIVFEKRSLVAAIAQLDRYYPGRILITRKIISSQKVTGIFSTTAILPSIKAIAATYGLSVVELPGRSLIILY